MKIRIIKDIHTRKKGDIINVPINVGNRFCKQGYSERISETETKTTKKKAIKGSPQNKAEKKVKRTK